MNPHESICNFFPFWIRCDLIYPFLSSWSFSVLGIKQISKLMTLFTFEACPKQISVSCLVPNFYFSHISHDSMTVRSEFPLLNAQLNRNSLKIPPLKPHLLPLLRFFQSETPHLLKFSLPPLFVHLPKNPSFRLPPKPSQAWLHSNEALQIASLRLDRTASKGAAAPCHCSSRPYWSRCPEGLRPATTKVVEKSVGEDSPKGGRCFLVYSCTVHILIINIIYSSVVHVRSVTSHISLWHLPSSIQYYLTSASQLYISIWTCNPLPPPKKTQKTSGTWRRDMGTSGVPQWSTKCISNAPVCQHNHFSIQTTEKNMLILQMT